MSYKSVKKDKNKANKDYWNRNKNKPIQNPTSANNTNQLQASKKPNVTKRIIEKAILWLKSMLPKWSKMTKIKPRIWAILSIIPISKKITTPINIQRSQ